MVPVKNGCFTLNIQNWCLFIFSQKYQNNGKNVKTVLTAWFVGQFWTIKKITLKSALLSLTICSLHKWKMESHFGLNEEIIHNYLIKITCKTIGWHKWRLWLGPRKKASLSQKKNIVTNTLIQSFPIEKCFIKEIKICLKYKNEANVHSF